MKQFLLGLTAALAAATMPAAAQTPLFTDTSEIQLVVEAPLTTLLRQAARNPQPHPGSVTLIGAGEPQRFEMELTARGVSRRTFGICTFPPLRIALQDGSQRGTLMQGQNRIKVVTLCRPGARYEQMHALEGLAYRMYNAVTDYSYGVRPARITYRDSEGRRREETQLNWLVEDIDDVARRNDRRVALDVTSGQLRYAQLNGRAATELALFQFMIGNLDWDMQQSSAGRDCCHNVRHIAALEGAADNIIPVPYDFDSSGLVDAPYAVPPEGLAVRNVRQRYYRGMCRFNDQLPAVIATFQSRRDAMNALIAAETRLGEARRTSTQRYIDEFYEIIADPERVQSQIIARCRG